MKVLIVDDNPKLLELLARLLEKEGYEVSAARSGDDALRKIHQIKPEIVFMDIVMPGPSGIEVCGRLKKMYPQLTVVMMSSQTRPEDVDKCMEAGASDFIPKPFDMAEISDRIRQITKDCLARAHPEVLKETFAIKDLDVFPGRMEAERAGQIIELNLRDIGILRVMNAMKGKPVPADMLRPFCWSTWAPSEEGAVEWYMEYLRKKIEPDPAAPALIRTLASGAYMCDG